MQFFSYIVLKNTHKKYRRDQVELFFRRTSDAFKEEPFGTEISMTDMKGADFCLSPDCIVVHEKAAALKTAQQVWIDSTLVKLAP